MPLVKRSEVDLLRFSQFTDVLVNPTNTHGSMSSGLAKAFKEQFPAMYDSYVAVCKDENGDAGKGALQVGKLHIYHNDETKNIIVNLPTKRFWGDLSNADDVELSCEKLAEYLRKHPFYTVAMPILAMGHEKLDVDASYAVMAKHLDMLPNIIHLCMRPERFNRPPLYLAVVGSRRYTDYDQIDIGVSDGLINFGLSWDDFEGMVSGGAQGVDEAACGTGDPDERKINIARAHGLKPIVCRADWDRYHKVAGFLRNRTVADIGTHFVAFVGSQSVGTRGLIDLVNRHNANVEKLQNARNYPTEGDVFFSTFSHPLPEKKLLYVHDISKVSV